MKLTCNKTKMKKLTKAMGYTPSKNAVFVKGYRSRHWWLEWGDDRGFYSATLSTAAGRAFFGMRYTEYDSDTPEKWNAVTLTLDQLKEFDLICEG